MPEADVRLFPAAFTPPESENYLQTLLETINWQQDHIRMFGKSLPLPRLTAWYGDSGAAYTYSGIRNEPQSWTPDLQQIKARVEALSKTSFNSVLLNYYRHNQDSMGWHADDEPELGQNAAIASVSFGVTRGFQFRHKTRKDLPKVKILLPSGSLLLMQGTTQHNWQHQVAKSAKVSGPRINLTFRYIHSAFLS